MYLVFSNPGEIDPRLITTLGVNVKEHDSPVGYFGTGLKYAIAITLRLGCEITVLSGAKRYVFRRTPGEIRGKTFDFIEMVEGETIVPLAFTIDLGKNWLPWMAYRELYCNAKDENGTATLQVEPPTPTPGWTHIIVAGDVIVSEHEKRNHWLLESEPIVDLPSLSIHLLPKNNPRALFYRGITVCTLDRPALYTYNIKVPLQLTEDRTYGQWGLHRVLARIFVEELSAHPLVLRSIATAREGTFESCLDWNWPSINVPEQFIELGKELLNNRRAMLSESLRSLLANHIAESGPEEAVLTPVEHKALDKALTFLRKHGYNITAPIIIVETLGSNFNIAMASSHTDTIYLSRIAFAKGTKYIVSTLLEEHLHLSMQLNDCSRAMQEYLLERVVTLLEDKEGEPL